MACCSNGLLTHLDSEPSDFSSCLCCTVLAQNSREASEDGCLHADFGQDLGAGDMFERLVEGKLSVRACTASMDDTLRNALVVEMRDALSCDRIMQGGGALRAGTQAGL